MKTTVSRQKEEGKALKAVSVVKRILFQNKTDSCTLFGCKRGRVSANHMRIGQHGICDTVMKMEIELVGRIAIAELGVRSRSVWSLADLMGRQPPFPYRSAPRAHGNGYVHSIQPRCIEGYTKDAHRWREYVCRRRIEGESEEQTLNKGRPKPVGALLSDKTLFAT